MFKGAPIWAALRYNNIVGGYFYIHLYHWRKIKMYDAIYARQSIEKVDSISVESQIDFCRYETKGGCF